MTLPTNLHTLQELRELGYAVVVFNPDELRGADVDRLEEILVERGNECIAQMATKPDPEVDLWAEPELHLYEVICPGFRGDTDKTDSRVLWVLAPGRAEVDDAVEGTSATWYSIDSVREKVSEDSIDFTLPQDLDELRAFIKSLS